MKVTSRDGQNLDITLNGPLIVMTVKRVDLAPITPGTFSAPPPGPMRTGNCERVLVFPEAMRGAGEGHYP
jgi:hypothetical protein